MTETNVVAAPVGVDKLAVALAKAQRAMGNVVKDANNPYYSSTYATLASVWDVIREPLTENGLSVVQLMQPGQDCVILQTILLHESGQALSSYYPVRPTRTSKDHKADGAVMNDTPQGWGSAITYARRYCLMALVGVAPEDDDGEAAMPRKKHEPAKVEHKPEPKSEPKHEAEAVDDLFPQFLKELEATEHTADAQKVFDSYKTRVPDALKYKQTLSKWLTHLTTKKKG